jgi:hypothetical protein
VAAGVQLLLAARDLVARNLGEDSRSKVCEIWEKIVALDFGESHARRLLDRGKLVSFWQIYGSLGGRMEEALGFSRNNWAKTTREMICGSAPMLGFL